MEKEEKTIVTKEGENREDKSVVIKEGKQDVADLGQENKLVKHDDSSSREDLQTSLQV